MDATKGHIFEFLTRESCNFYIPVYQREYSWDKARCKTLLDDLERLRLSRVEHSHFFGSIVYIPKYEGSGVNNWLIDGQQRITTISLLILAIYRSLEDRKIKLLAELPDASEEEAEKINRLLAKINSTMPKMENCFYKDPDVEAHLLEPKIKLSDVDDPTYRDILFRKIASPSNNLGFNYLMFLDEANNKDIDELFEYYECIKKLQIVHVYLDDSADDPQLIFESINSKLFPLSEADKIRNYIFMKAANYDVQKRLFDDYWKEIEANTKKAPTQLIKNYLIIKTSDYVAEDKLYYPFKEFMQKHDEIDSETVLKDLLTYSKHMKVIYEYKYNSDEPYKKSIYYLLKLKNNTIIPLVICCLEKLDKGEITKDDLNEIMDYVESYIVRRNFMPFFSTKPLNKIFASINKEAEKLVETEAKSYKDAIIKILSTRAQKSRFPTDEEFKENFGKKELYSQRAFCIYILERLSNYGERELIDVDDLCSKNVLTIEHVMPQSLSAHWEAYLGADFDIIHNKYLNTIGNLTLIAYNSELGNLPFKDKKTDEHGYLASSLTLNTFIKNQDDWKEQQMIDRANELLEIALKIWKAPLPIVTKKKRGIEEFKDIELNDEFLDNPETPIGMLVRVSFVKLFEGNLLTDEDINNLTDQRYSSDNLGCWLPVLTNDETKIFDENNRYRYYAEGCIYEGNGETYYICSQFQDRNDTRNKVVTWVKAHLPR